ncbi:MAG: methyltransferase domain-containing protein [Deltaproteobacteria bacterium]|nr:methyltransferase domain-containing protein [Deltaproteobacteria bacterium]MCB9786243.1 methyltransferase domain-containing protein [Deltaproteobacteria bacterium]
MTGRPGDDEDAAARVMEMLGGKWMTQMVSTAASLGIPDALADAPLGTDALAEALGCHAPSLGRLLRAMAGGGLVEEDLDGRFALTALGAQLRRGALGELAIFVGSDTQWRPWSALGETIRTGQPAFDRVHDRSLYEHLEAHPADAAIYDAAVDAFTRHQARALAASYDFGAIGTLVDVGGGRGTLLVELLSRFEGLRGVLFDLPHVASAARAHLADRGLADRVRVVGGDFFEAVPEGADAYVLKHVLHNWDDAHATQILARCADAMAPGGVVMVVESVVLPGNRPDATRLLDLEMLVLTHGGRERTKPELRHLFHEAGLRLRQGLPLAEGVRLLVGARR